MKWYDQALQHVSNKRYILNTLRRIEFLRKRGIRFPEVEVFYTILGFNEEKARRFAKNC